MSYLGVFGLNPSVVRLGSSGEHREARYSSRQVLDMLGIQKREVRQWLGNPGMGSVSPETKPQSDVESRADLEVEFEAGHRPQADDPAQYSSNDVQLLRSAKELRRNEVPARKIREAFASLKRRLPAGSSPLALRLIGEGEKVIARDDEGGTWDVESGQQLFNFASTHSLWPSDAAVPLENASGELRYGEPGAPAIEGKNVLRYEDRRSVQLDARAWYEKARERELTSRDGAVAAYQEALALDPEMVDALIDLGRLHHQNGDLKSAETHYSQALELEPSSATANFNRAVVLEDLGHHDGAIDAYTRTLAVDPLYGDAYYNLSRLYEARGERTAALRCLQSYRRVQKR